MASAPTSQAMPPQATAGFSPGNVSSTDAFNWCLSQQHTCPIICNGDASVNTCNPDSFTYSCSCSNGTIPDCTAFTDTLPFFVCQATFAQCISNHPDDAAGQETCLNNEQCGTRNATALELTGQASTTVIGVTSYLTETPTALGSTLAPTTVVYTSTEPYTSSASTISPTQTTSTVSSSTSLNPHPTTQAPPSRQLSTGVIAGISVGCTLVAIILAVLLSWFVFTRRSRPPKDKKEEVNAFPRENEPDKPELFGSISNDSYPQGYRGHVVNSKAELMTNANRHEMDDTRVSAILEQPWSAGPYELSGEGRRNELGPGIRSPT